MALASARDIVAGLKDYGLKVRERAGWETRGTGYRFEPIGQAWHHDAISEAMSDANAEAMLANGRPDLRGPLCNGAVDSDATVVLIAYGNANHAGWNERDVIDRLRAGKAPLGDACLDPDGDTVVGNPLLWGWECRNTGIHGDVWEQLDAMERAGAAMCDVNGWPSAANAAHRELTARKPDPVDIHMPTFRADIQRIRIAHHAPPIAAPEEDMQTTLITRTDSQGDALLFLGGKLFNGKGGAVVPGAGVVKLAVNGDVWGDIIKAHGPVID